MGKKESFPRSLYFCQAFSRKFGGPMFQPTREPRPFKRPNVRSRCLVKVLNQLPNLGGFLGVDINPTTFLEGNPNLNLHFATGILGGWIFREKDCWSDSFPIHHQDHGKIRRCQWRLPSYGLLELVQKATGINVLMS